jgi:hypothetical protein
VLYTRNTIEYRDSTLAAIVPAAVVIDHRVDELRDRRERLAAERAIDDVLADSFSSKRSSIVESRYHPSGSRRQLGRPCVWATPAHRCGGAMGWAQSWR